MIISPIRNKIIAAKPLQPIKLNIERTLAINAIEEMLSNKKNTPINAISQSKLILGTNNKRIPIVKIKTPIKIDQIIFDK